MMKSLALIKIAFRGLVRQKVRTFLTSFAVFIGVFLIIFMVSATTGGQQILLEQFTSNFDLKNIQVASKGTLQFNFNSFQVEDVEVKPVNDETIDEIKNIKDVAKVQPIVTMTGKTVTVEGQEKPLKGQFGGGFDLTADDRYIKEIKSGNVRELETDEALLNYKVADAYSLSLDEIVGRTITVKDDTTSFISSKIKDTGKEYVFKVVGVVDIGNQQVSFIVSADQAIAMQALRGGFNDSQEYKDQIGYDQVYVSARSENLVNDVAQQIRDMGYDAMTIEEVISIFSNVTSIISVVFSMFGVIALLVASVGIVNTMIMSVYERTKEIGVLKAIGASRRDIRDIFLSESAMIGFTGGVMGLVAALGLMAVVESILLNQVFPAQNIEIANVFTTPWWLIVGPVVFATFIGILAGLYPAIRASRLNPVDALRYE